MHPYGRVKRAYLLEKLFQEAVELCWDGLFVRFRTQGWTAAFGRREDRERSLDNESRMRVAAMVAVFRVVAGGSGEMQSMFMV